MLIDIYRFLLQQRIKIIFFRNLNLFVYHDVTHPGVLLEMCRSASDVKRKIISLRYANHTLYIYVCIYIYIFQEYKLPVG